MKNQVGATDTFISPTSGSIGLDNFPALNQNQIWVGDSSNRPVPTNFTRGLATLITFTTSGTWTVPAGISNCKITCVGGGGGGSCANADGCGGGGGGGATAISYLTVTPGASLTITVGAGGNGGTGGIRAPVGQNGSPTSVSSGSTVLVKAAAGSAQSTWKANSPGGDGGTATGSLGNLILNGIEGGGSISNLGTNFNLGGSGGGTSLWPMTQPVLSYSGLSPMGKTPLSNTGGGGGSGSSWGASTIALGGNGATGIVIIEY